MILVILGRFGNQADHFLGALGFANGLNRTLILPPWVEYRYGEPKSIQVPFDTYFKVEPLQKKFKVILMHDFMEKIAPYEWPPEKRISFCYMTRGKQEHFNFLFTIYLFIFFKNVQVLIIVVMQRKVILLALFGILLI